MAASSAPKFTLHYFNIRGKAEPIRLMLEDQGFPYDEVRIESSTWWTGGEKQKYHDTGLSPFGQLPVATYGDMRMAQSLAIMRYLAKKTGCYGPNDEVQFRCDMLADGAEDWRSAYVDLVYNSAFDELKDGYLKGAQAKFLNMFEALLANSNDAAPFYCGASPVFADYLVWEMLDLSLRLDASCLAAFPRLSRFYRALAERPRVAAYLASGRRPVKPNNSRFG